MVSCMFMKWGKVAVDMGSRVRQVLPLVVLAPMIGGCLSSTWDSDQYGDWSQPEPRTASFSLRVNTDPEGASIAVGSETVDGRLTTQPAGTTPLTLNLTYPTVEKWREKWAVKKRMYYIPFDQSNPHYETIGDVPGSRQREVHRDATKKTYSITASKEGYTVETTYVTVPSDKQNLLIFLSPSKRER